MQPLYQTILNDLKKQIETGQLRPTDQVPTEKELSERYKVSRITSKRALTELELAGLITRIRGKGSFVTDHPANASPAGSAQKRILFLLPFSGNLALGNFPAGLQPILQKNEYDVMMTNYAFLNTHDAKAIMQEFAGLIYYAPYNQQHLELLFNLSLKHFPVIVLDKEISDLSLPTIMSDNFSGGVIATQHLLDLGHTRIGYLFGETKHAQSTRQRYLGYLQALTENKVTFHTALTDPIAVTAHLTAYCAQNQFTALVCENDLVAIKAMQILKNAGCEVPENISVVGFDNIQAAGLVSPALTTISQDFKQIGELAGTQLIHWIETKQAPSSSKIPVQLILRKSTKELTHD